METNNIYDRCPFNISLTPKFGACFDFMRDGYNTRKTILLVPHVIKNKEDSAIITWRCNWGNACNSGCIYATIKERRSAEVAKICQDRPQE
jgi:hypothetical protein